MKRTAVIILTVFAAGALAQPYVSGTLPPELQASESRQWITVVGSGFVSGSTVSLAWGSREFLIPSDRTTYVDSGNIRVFAGIFPADPTWTVVVRNPDGAVSSPVGLVFVASDVQAQPGPEPEPATAVADTISPQLQATIDRTPDRLRQLLGAMQDIRWSSTADERLCTRFADAWWDEPTGSLRRVVLVSFELESDDEVGVVRESIDAAARRLNYYVDGWIRNLFNPIHFGTIVDPADRYDRPRVEYEFVLFQQPAGSTGVYGCAFALLLPE